MGLRDAVDLQMEKYRVRRIDNGATNLFLLAFCFVIL